MTTRRNAVSLRLAAPGAMRHACILTLSALALATGAHAQAANPKFTYMTNWYAQAEHGGMYQALATGLYDKHGLDVTIKMGGPQVNIVQMMAGRQADCVMGTSDLQMLQVRASGVPVKTVGAWLQKDPQALITHDGITSFEQLKDKTILIGGNAHQSYWPWLKKVYGFTDSQTRPYTYNIQPFIADKNVAQQAYFTSEPFAVQKAGVKANTLMFADYGFPAYAATVTCMDDTVKNRSKEIEAFLAATAEGWASYLQDPAPGNALIKKENPNMTDEQLAFSLGRLRETGIVNGGDAATKGIGTITPERAQASYDFLVDVGLLDPAKVTPEQAYDLTLIQSVHSAP
ncbi:SsuA/THI5-like domain-containing protein [Kerstersia similis]